MYQATERLTWDATYQGLPLTRRAYDAHLLMLDRVASGETIDVTSLDDLDQHEAWVALARGGLVRTHHPTSSDVSYEHRITPLGVVYLRQRAADLDRIKNQRGLSRGKP